MTRDRFCVQQFALSPRQALPWLRPVLRVPCSHRLVVSFHLGNKSRRDHTAPDRLQRVSCLRVDARSCVRRERRAVVENTKYLSSNISPRRANSPLSGRGQRLTTRTLVTVRRPDRRLRGREGDGARKEHEQNPSERAPQLSRHEAASTFASTVLTSDLCLYRPSTWIFNPHARSAFRRL